MFAGVSQKWLIAAVSAAALFAMGLVFLGNAVGGPVALAGCYCSCYRTESATIFCNAALVSPGADWVSQDDGYGTVRYQRTFAWSFAESRRGQCPEACGSACSFPPSLYAQIANDLQQAQSECLLSPGGWFEEEAGTPQIHCDTVCPASNASSSQRN